MEVTLSKKKLSVRAQNKRQQILESATQVFCEFGYDAATMSIIAARVGGSKGTLYNHFPSKEDLLLATMIEAAEKFSSEIMDGLEEKQSLESFLKEVIKRFIHKVYVNPKTARLLRVAITVGERSKVGQEFFNIIGDGIWGEIKKSLPNKLQGTRLEHLDPHLVTLFIRGLCEADLMRLLMGAMPNFTAQEADKRALEIIHLIFNSPTAPAK